MRREGDRQIERKVKEVRDGDRDREYKSGLLLSLNPLSIGITSIEQDLLHISSIIPPPHREHFLFDREECVCVCFVKAGCWDIGV